MHSGAQWHTVLYSALPPAGAPALERPRRRTQVRVLSVCVCACVCVCVCINDQLEARLLSILMSRCRLVFLYFIFVLFALDFEHLNRNRQMLAREGPGGEGSEGCLKIV